MPIPGEQGLVKFLPFFFASFCPFASLREPTPPTEVLSNEKDISREGVKGAKKTLSPEPYADTVVNSIVFRLPINPTILHRLKIVLLCALAIVIYIEGGEYFAVLAFRLFLKFFPADLVVGLLVVGYWRDQFKGR